MATVVSINERPIGNKYTTIDINIMEYFYGGVTFNEVMSDNDLMDLILNNGYYKMAFCEAFNIEEMIINHDGIDYKLCGRTESNIPSILDLVKGNTDVVPVDVKIINGE